VADAPNALVIEFESVSFRVLIVTVEPDARRFCFVASNVVSPVESVYAANALVRAVVVTKLVKALVIAAFIWLVVE